jgi:hypothetical protein
MPRYTPEQIKAQEQLTAQARAAYLSDTRAVDPFNLELRRSAGQEAEAIAIAALDEREAARPQAERDMELIRASGWAKYLPRNGAE